MMNPWQEETPLTCPYCGETITVMVDTSVAAQKYIEDCQVCCRPIVIRTSARADGSFEIEARHEDEV